VNWRRKAIIGVNVHFPPLKATSARELGELFFHYLAQVASLRE